MKPFLKWAGGKRWLVGHNAINLPRIQGTYIEPFLGGGAVFFNVRPAKAILSDLNPRLIETYIAIQQSPQIVWELLKVHQKEHSKEHYYSTRDISPVTLQERAAQFIYLNRACWNGLYRENLKGQFNVPIGTKKAVIFGDDDFAEISAALSTAEIYCSDFESIIDQSSQGDFIFADPPYTTAHNVNGFVKYNEKIFNWEDQVRLANSLIRARARGVHFMLTNADHSSVRDLYLQSGLKLRSVERFSVIAANSSARTPTTELVVTTTT